jgi:hypothetical protein
MANIIEGYWLSVVTSDFFVINFTTDPFPPGTSLYANISLSEINTLFSGNNPNDPTFAATAFIDSWTVYQEDGTESAPIQGQGFAQNAIGLDNCARIHFVLVGDRVAAIAQVNIFR